jgi:hypothetical protein
MQGECGRWVYAGALSFRSGLTLTCVLPLPDPRPYLCWPCLALVLPMLAVVVVTLCLSCPHPSRQSIVISIAVATTIVAVGEFSLFPHMTTTFIVNLPKHVMPLILSCLHALRLCFLLTIFVRLDHFYRLSDSLWTLPLSRYLAALVSMRLTMLTFLFRIHFSHSCCLCLLSSLLDTYTRESSLQILTQTCLLLTKYYTKLLSANYQVADVSPYCIMN